MRIVVLAGGIGGSRFLLGVRAEAGRDSQQNGDSAEPVTAIINTADDVTLHGLRICPDLDSVMYTLGAGIDPERGWGRAKETWTVKDELAAYGAEPTWFGLGDRDIATHLIRTRMLDAGYPLSAVTEALGERWRPGVKVLPMTDDRVETHVVVADDDKGTNRRAMHFQEWWIRHHAELRAEKFVPTGAEDASAAPGVVAAIAAADVVLIAPSNPVVSIGTILSIDQIRTALAQTSAPVIGLSPIIGGAAVRGMAEKCLPVIGAEVSAAGVARLYGARRDGGLLDGWLVDETDAGTSVDGIEVRAVPLWMTDVDTTAAMARAALDVAQEVGKRA
jgi:LPPG:FO 2-phospho-L-lactate transferase